MSTKTKLMVTQFNMLPIKRDRETIGDMFHRHFAVLKLEAMEQAREAEINSRFLNRKVSEKQKAMSLVVDRYGKHVLMDDDGQIAAKEEAYKKEKERSDIVVNNAIRIITGSKIKNN